MIGERGRSVEKSRYMIVMRFFIPRSELRKKDV